jgi:hypothetical protein
MLDIGADGFIGISAFGQPGRDIAYGTPAELPDSGVPQSGKTRRKDIFPFVYGPADKTQALCKRLYPGIKVKQGQILLFVYRENLEVVVYNSPA